MATPCRSRSYIRLTGGLIAGATVLALLSLPAMSQDPTVSEAFSRGQYNEARSLLGEMDAPAGEDLLLQLRLTRDPDEALLLAKQGQADARDDRPLLTTFVYEEASIHFARGNYLDALRPLDELMNRSNDPLPGAVYVLAGQTLRCLQERQRAREALATVPADDPAFPWARYFLGRVALDEADEALALRYFETAGRSELADRYPSLLAGRWDALRLAGQHEEASRVMQRVYDEYPLSLAAMHLRERGAGETTAPLLAGATSDSAATSPEEVTGRLSLQLAAFADRGRALAFFDTWRSRLSDLRIDEEESDDGVPMYKLRTGQFASRGQAHTEAERLRRAHGIELMVVESGR